uniref:Hsp20/alpha crystallin family protein n=1 Tax=Bradyrhizobium sp. (strain ORS 278) TaxID=114615 RepID=UPI0012FEC32F|nr:Hsp20/alpha crystallin family protein [Bradyrhizobium sp. ORS 278]
MGDLAETLKEKLQGAGEGTDGAGQHEFEINTPGGPLKGVMGYSVRSGILGQRPSRARPPNSEFNPGRKTGSDVDTAREPLAEVHSEDDQIVYTIELPGVAEDQIQVTIAGQELVVETSGPKRYRAAFPLEQAVDPESRQTSLRNGILQVSLRKV